VSGANVVATHVETNQHVETTSDHEGRFRFPYLRTGAYDLKIDAAGFASVAKQLTVSIGQALDLPVKLEVAGVSAAVNIGSDVPIVETVRTQITETIRPKEMNELPLNGRNFLDLSLLIPGVSPTNTGSNQRFAEMLQVPAMEVFGRRLQSYLMESDWALWGALEREAIERGAAHGEIVLEPPRASPVPVHVALAPFGRGAVGMSVMVTDLSDQKRHEAVLAAETLSKSILEQAADAIVVCDAAGTIIRTSHVAEELCGRNAMLLPFDSVFPLAVSGGGPIDAPTQRVSLREVLEGKTVRGLEVLLRREDGGPAHLLMSAAPLKQDRRTVGCVVTLTDITDQKAAERLLRESDRKKDEFLAVLGHELRNALGPVRNANQILDRADAGEDDLRVARAMLDRQVTHMTRLIDDLLDVSRIAQGKILLRKELFDIGALVRTVTADHRSLLEAGDLRLELYRLGSPHVRQRHEPISGIGLHHHNAADRRAFRRQNF